MISAVTVSGVLLGSTSTPRFRRTAPTKNSVATELSSLTSQFGGLKLSQIAPFKSISTPRAPVFKPLARRVCPFTGKKANKANLVSFSNHRTIKRQFVNLQYKRIWWEEGKRFVKLRLSTKALKTIEKNGLDAVAKKAGFNLLKKAGPTLEKIAEVSQKQKAKKELLDKAEQELKEKLEATLRLKK